VDDRNRRVFEEQYIKKKEELQTQVREKAALEEQQWRKSMRKQAFWGAVMTEFRKTKDAHIEKEIERRRKIEDMEAKARREWLQILNEEWMLWTKDPGDLRWRKYDIKNPRFMKRFKEGHTFNLYSVKLR